MRRISRSTGVLFTLAGLVWAAGVGQAQEPDGSVATTTFFALHSDFDVNLHDALLEAGRDRYEDAPELFHSGEESSCFTRLSRPLRSAWDHAVGFYAESISPPQAGSRQFEIRLALIGIEPEEQDGRQLVEIAATMRAAAAPAYNACRWTAQDRENREWIAQVVPLVEAHGETIAARLAELYEKPLDGLPIRTDVAETVSWSGANTIYLTPEGGHIWISKESGDGVLALETIFHEASHLLTGRGAPIPKALEAAARELGVQLPRDLWHAVQFYTTGNVVARVWNEKAGAAAESASGYSSIMFTQGTFGEFHDALKEAWIGYLEGTKSLEEAAEDLVRIVGER